MADTLNFSLVSPSRELFAGEVAQVDLPGTEGNLGILPGHAPLMAAIRSGVMTVYADGTATQYVVRGGFADVTPAGLTVLAESADAVAEIDLPGMEAEIKSLEDGLAELSGDAAFATQRDIDGLRESLAVA